MSHDTIAILLLNVRSLSKRACDIKNDVTLMSNDVLYLRETQPQYQHSLNGIQQYFENFNISFNNNDNKFLSLAHAFQKNLTLITQEHFPGVSIYNFRISSFINAPLKLRLLYKLNNQLLMTFFILLY